MKYFLSSLLFLFTLTLSAQNSEPIKKSVVTNYVSSSRMVWSYSEERYIYFPNNDESRFSSLWDFILNSNGSGSLRSGDVIYSISSWDIQTTPENIELLNINAFSHKLGREVNILVGRPEGKVFMAFYDYEGLTSYYFYE